MLGFPAHGVQGQLIPQGLIQLGKSTANHQGLNQKNNIKYKVLLGKSAVSIVFTWFYHQLQGAIWANPVYRFVIQSFLMQNVPEFDKSTCDLDMIQKHSKTELPIDAHNWSLYLYDLVWGSAPFIGTFDQCPGHARWTITKAIIFQSPLGDVITKYSPQQIQQLQRAISGDPVPPVPPDHRCHRRRWDETSSAVSWCWSWLWLSGYADGGY